MRFAFIIVILAGLLAPSSALAAEPSSAVILDLEAENADKQLVDTLTSIVRNEALQVEKYQVVNEFPIRLSDVALLIGCSPDSTSCLKQVAAEVDARVMIYGAVRQFDESSYQIELNIFDATNGRMLNRLTRTLSDTTDPMVGFRKEIENFFAEERGKAMTRLQIGASVDGAEVRIDDALIGVVPIERKGLPPSGYTIRVSHPGYEVWEEKVSLVSGADEKIWAQLVAVKTGEEPVARGVTLPESSQPDVAKQSDPPRSRGLNWGAWSAVSVGALALGGSVGFGIALEGVEKKLESEAADGALTAARYQELFDRGEGFELSHRILLGVGVVSVATGIIWLIVDGRGESAASILLTPSGVATRWRW